MRRTLGSLVLAAVLAATGSARANGRFPESNHVFFSPNEPETVLLRTTFGLLVSRDRGTTWDWICEQAIGTTGAEDPMYAITPSGTILASTFAGLAVTRDRGCGWSFFGGDLTEQVFIDLSANPNDPKHVVVFASSYDRQDDAGNILFTSKIWETKDEGQTFAPLGAPLPTSLLGATIDLTQTDPDRVYVSGAHDPGQAPRAVLLASKDYGATWTETPIPLVDTERNVYIAAVDPTNADRIYVRTSNAVDKPTRLLFSEDGAQTFRTIYTGKGALLGFALSQDGGKVFVGGPQDGIQVASTTDFRFAQTSSIATQCLIAATDGLWVCSNEQHGFIVAISPDDGRTFEKQTRFCDIRGPFACAEGTRAGQLCPALWPSQKSLLGCGDPPRDAGLLDGGAAQDLVEPGGGFTCAFAGAPPFAAAAFGLAGVAAALVARRLRRGRSR